MLYSAVEFEEYKDGGWTPWQAGFLLLLNPGLIYYTVYLTLSCMGLYDYQFVVPLVFDIIKKFPLAMDVINSVIKPRKTIMWTLILGGFCAYIFAFITFEYFREDFHTVNDDDGNHENPDPEFVNCDTLGRCFGVFTYYGLIADGGAGDTLAYTLGLRGWVIDFLYYVVIMLIMLNIIFGIIIDTFSERRQEVAQNLKDTLNICFICGIDKRTFDRAGDGTDGFRVHTKSDHNMWNYLFFMIFIWEQDKDDDDGLEYYVRHKVDKLDLSWFPMNKALCLVGKKLSLNGEDPENDEEEDKSEEEREEEIAKAEEEEFIAAVDEGIETYKNEMKMEMEKLEAAVDEVKALEKKLEALDEKNKPKQDEPNQARPQRRSSVMKITKSNDDDSDIPYMLRDKDLSVRVVLIMNIHVGATRSQNIVAKIISKMGKVTQRPKMHDETEGILEFDEIPYFMVGLDVSYNDYRAVLIEIREGEGVAATLIASIELPFSKVLTAEGLCLQHGFDVVGQKEQAVLLLEVKTSLRANRPMIDFTLMQESIVEDEEDESDSDSDDD
jgi:hypothetical protein